MDFSQQLFKRLVYFEVVIGLLFFLTQLLVNHSITHIHFYWLGLDYEDFYKASLNFVNAINPYDVLRYNKPPTVTLFNAPLTLFSIQTAFIVFSIGSFISCVLAILLAQATFSPYKVRHKRLNFLMIVMAILFSYPMLFVLNRGNLDGYVALFCFLGFYIWAVKNRPFWGGCALGVAACIKVYPIVFLLPLICMRRVRVAMGMLFSVGLFFLTLPHQWYIYLSNIIPDRIHFIGYSNGFFENASLANTLFLIAHLYAKTVNLITIYPFLSPIAFIIVLALLYLCLRADMDNLKNRPEMDIITAVALYLPFMLIVPKVVYHYQLLLLIPLLFVWQRILSEGNFSSKLIGLLATLFLLASQFQIQELISLMQQPPWIIGCIPGLSAFCLTLLTVYVKVKNTRNKVVERRDWNE